MNLPFLEVPAGRLGTPVRLVIDGKTKPYARTRTSEHGFRFETRETKDFKAWCRMAGREAMAGRPLFAGAVHVRMSFVKEVPASKPAWWKEAALAGWILPQGKPDIDNLMKGVKDALKGVVWTDDALIVTGHYLKIYGDKPAAIVDISAIRTVSTKADWLALNEPTRWFPESGQ